MLLLLLMLLMLLLMSCSDIAYWRLFATEDSEDQQSRCERTP